MEERAYAPAIVGIPELVPDSTLLSRWTPQNIAVHARDGQGRDAPCSLYEVWWQSSVWNGATRRLVNQSHGYFMQFRQQCEEEEGDAVRFSRFYRSALHECVLGLRKMAKDSSLSEQEQERSSQEAQLLSLQELVWHLCEVLFLEVLPAGCLVQQLLEWTRWHCGQQDELLPAILTHPRPEEHAEFWQAVYGLVLKGRMGEARDLLMHHTLSHAIPDVFASMDELLRKAPMVRSVGSLSRGKLHQRWQDWRGECRRRKDAGEFLATPQLHLLARILCGDEEAFRHPEVVDCCLHWDELMVGKLLFTSPLIMSGDYDLVYTAESCASLYAPSRGSLDRILFAALKNDIMEMIKLSSSSFSNWWFVAHLTDLLHHRGLLVASQLEYGEKLSEFLILEYASSLMTHQSLWQVAMDYFSECSTQGQYYMALYIERVPLTTPRVAEKVLRVCKRYQLKEQVQSVCRVMAVQAYRSGQLGKALSWCLQAKDSAFAAFLAEKYFDRYQSLGEFIDLDLLDHLGATMLLSEKLTFLCKYREFHRLHERRQFAVAGDLLVKLLLSNTVPQRFWLTLLTDALQLLVLEDQLVFNTEQTYALSHFLQELTLSTLPFNQSASSSEQEDESGEGKVALLRLALTKNLARAMLEAPHKQTR